jgi:hypothetical protein
MWYNINTVKRGKEFEHCARRKNSKIKNKKSLENLLTFSPKCDIINTVRFARGEGVSEAPLP